MRSYKIKHLIILVLIIIISCKPKTKLNDFHPMVDGRNLEWDQLNKKTFALSDDVNLFFFQNEYYVWIGYDFPEGSYGTMDMTILTDKIEAPLNLHISAQLGEWLVGDEENIPKTGTSDLWWNNNGWTANNLWVNGIDTISYDTPEFNIKNGDIRELQLSKERFGIGEWKIKLKINAIKSAEDKFVNLEFPEDKDFYFLIVS